MRLIPTILCGGAGSRLWPVSRELHPKPFIRLADGESLLQKAFLRGARLKGVSDVVAVTNREFFFITRDEIAEVNQQECRASFILESEGRGTAAAVATAALMVANEHGGDAVMLVLAADHLIVDEKAFASAVAAATQLAQAGRLVTFGIKPDSPNTGYGYIEVRGNDVLRFVEKPSHEKAEEYLSSGRFLWNSGMFCFTAGHILAEMQKHCPAILQSVTSAVSRSKQSKEDGVSRLELDAATFSAVPNDSLDYAVMERASGIAVIPCEIGWSDIGSWNAIEGLATADAEGNRIEGTAVLHDVTACYIRSEGRVVGGVGIDNLIIVDTPDALLVAAKDRAQDVKQIYSKLKSIGHESHRIHRTVHRPWGTYTVLEEGPGFKIKRIEVRAGASLSLQMHHHRSEHWVVVSGTAAVVNGDQQLTINANQSTYIPAGNKHRLSNATQAPLVIIEVQSGGYLGEDDIVRFDDRYGRTEPKVPHDVNK